MSYKFVTKALGKLNKIKTNYDVIIHIGEEPDFKEFHSNSKTLCNKSDYFKEILSTKDIEKKDGKYIIKKPNITPQVFEVIIKYLSTRNINLTNKNGMEILKIITVSDDLKLNQLIKIAEEFLIKHHQQFLRNDTVEILEMIYYRKNLNIIQECCLETICFNPKILFNSDKFINLPAPLLEIILKLEILYVNEIEVWENLIKWGLTQEKSLDENVTKWYQEEFNIFGKILHKFIPLIRFYNISSEDYYKKVRPYEKMLSIELREEILKFHMVPGHKPTLNNLSPRRPVDSTLINHEHIVLFANWIDRKEENSKYLFRNIPYEFKLILRGSRDGFNPKSFHNKCDDKGASIVVIKIKNSDQIVGGYNPLDWSGSGWKNTSDSFIFSFHDYKNVCSGKISRIINTAGKISSNYNGAVISNPAWGPVFGRSNHISCDLCMHRNGRWSSYPNSYPDINIPRNYFDIDDYEVFQVKKNMIIH